MSELSRRDTLRGAAGLAAGGLLRVQDGQAEAGEFERPNLVFVLADQLRWCALPIHGNAVCRTPALDALAADGLVFEHALAASPKCESYRTSLMTGLWPTASGVALDVAQERFARSFKAAGYRTGYIGKWHLTPEPTKNGFVPPEVRPDWDWFAGHEAFHRYFSAHYFVGDDRKRRVLEGYEPFGQVELAREFIGREPQAPFCLVLSMGPPHGSSQGRRLKLPAEWEHVDPASIELRPNVDPAAADDAREILARYYTLVQSLDRAIARLIAVLDATGIRERTLLVVTSDHGVMHHSHGLQRKQAPFEEALRVPLVLHQPGRFAGEREGRAITAVDLLPTLLGLTGVPVPEGLQGRDVLVGEPGDGVSFLQNPFSGPYTWLGQPWRGVRSPRYKYAVSGAGGGPEVLFDLREDPYERRDLSRDATHRSERAALRARCEALAESFGDRFFEG